MKKLVFIPLLLLAALFFSACAQKRSIWKCVTFYNAENTKIELKAFTGVDIYHGAGPSDYGGTILHPKTPGMLHTRLDIELNYPIQAVYRELGTSSDYIVQEISATDNVESSVITEESTLVVLFENGQFRMILFKGVSGFTKQDLDRMYGKK